MRSCDGCGTRLRGPKFHGFVKGAALVCGRSSQKRTIVRDGKPGLLLVKTPECSW